MRGQRWGTQPFPKTNLGPRTPEKPEHGLLRNIQILVSNALMFILT